MKLPPSHFSLPRRGHLVTEPASAPPNRTHETMSDVDIPVRPPRTGVNTAAGVRGLGVEEVVFLEFRTGVAAAWLLTNTAIAVTTASRSSC